MISGDALLLRDGANEIRALRHENEVLRAKVEVIELFDLILRPNRLSGRIVGQDVAWLMEKRAEQLGADREAEKAVADGEHSDLETARAAIRTARAARDLGGGGY